MYLATVNIPKQLLFLNFIGNVKVEEISAGRENLIELVNALKPGFRLLADMSLLESFGPNCATEIGSNMRFFSDKGVSMVVRVMPDSSKDFGLNILAFFHYAPHLRTVVCETMVEAAKVLSL
jgi:hypothetical protein